MQISQLYRSGIMMVALAGVSACAQTPAQQNSTAAPPVAATVAPATSVSTTAGPTDAATSAPQTTSAPTGLPSATAVPAAKSGPLLIYNRADNGSVEALDIASQAIIVLADPTDPNQLLPWSLSPDGTTMAVVTGRGWNKGAPDNRAALWVVGVDGSNPQKLLDLGMEQLPTDMLSVDPALISGRFQRLPWTSDNHIIVASSHEGQVDLYAVAADGSGVQRLTTTPDLEFGAVVDADGSTLGYADTTTFGTGAGWGGFRSWILTAGGGPQAALPSDIGEPTYGTIAWVGNTLVSQVGNMADMGAIAAAQVGQPPRTLAKGAALLPADMNSQGLAYAECDGSGCAVMTMGANDAAPKNAGRIDTMADTVFLSPSGNAAVVCSARAEGTAKQWLWNGTNLLDYRLGACPAVVAWSNDGFAISGDNTQPSGQGFVYGLDGGARETMFDEALVLGWAGPSLLYTVGDINGNWRMFRWDIAQGRPAFPVGDAIPGQPQQPRIVQ